MTYTKSDIWTDCGQQQLWVRKWHCDHGGGERLWRSWNWATVTRGVGMHAKLLYKECSSAEVTHTQCLWRWTGWAPWQTSQQPATLCWTLSCCPPNSVVHIYKGGSRTKVSSTLLSLLLLYFVEIMTLLTETYRVSSGVAPPILNFSIKWRRVHNVIPWPLYPARKEPQYPLNGRLSRLWTWSGYFLRRENVLPLLGFKLHVTWAVA